MTQDRLQTDASETGTADEEVDKILEDKADIVEAQEEATDDRDSDEGFTAEDSTGVNAENEESIDPAMPRMPPA